MADISLLVGRTGYIEFEVWGEAVGGVECCWVGEWVLLKFPVGGVKAGVPAELAAAGIAAVGGVVSCATGE